MSFRKILVALAVCPFLVPAVALAAGGAKSSSKPARASDSGIQCRLPESDAEALVILSNYYPRGYWWDHADLTIAVQAHPSATEEQIAAINEAIAIWSNTLEECFGG